MKIFFDTNVYVAEALLGEVAQRIVDATLRARWRVCVSEYVLDEVQDVLIEDVRSSRRMAVLTRWRIRRRSVVVASQSSAEVPDDPKDNPILQAALTCGADYLVTNDRHLLSLNPFEGLRIVSMSDYYRLLKEQGLL